MSKVAFLFPGQGSQFIGMGKALYDSFTEAKETFQEVDEALNQNLSKLIFSGDSAELTKTENTQPAIMVTSIAVIRVLEKQSGKSFASFVTGIAGHSLGEYSALCAAKSFSLTDTAKLLQIRGKSMQAAVPFGEGAMAALIGATVENTLKVIAETSSYGVCQIANDNGAGQIVISGNVEAVDKAIELCGSFGIRKAIKLQVSAPFHCDLMAPAANAMKDALEEVDVASPICDTISNISVTPYKSQDEIRDSLVKQVTSMVRWHETIEYFIKTGTENFVEIGPGKVLTTLAKRIHEGAVVSNILEPQDFEQFFNNYN